MILKYNVLRFAQAYNLGLVNTFFQKQEEHLITYKSWNRRTTLDYILVKRTDLKAAKYCKVIPGESIAMQHRILVMDYRLKTPRKKQTRQLNKQIRWWTLKKEEARAEYKASVTTKLDEIGLDLDWNKIQEILVSTAKDKLGQTRGKELMTRKRVYGGTKTPDVLPKLKKRHSKHTRPIRVKNSTVHTRTPTKLPREL